MGRVTDNIKRQISAVAHGYSEIPSIEGKSIRKLEKLKKTPSGDFNTGYNAGIDDVIKALKGKEL